MARPRGALALVLLALLAGCADSPDDRARDHHGRPNVVVLMTDDQTVESLRVMPGVRRRLAARGTTFSRSFVSFPLCCPSRATFLTGQYAHNHGVVGNRPPTGGYGALDAAETLPVWLGRAGYVTMHVGKFLNRYGIDGPPTEVPPGWDEWHASVDPLTYEYYGARLNENGTLRTYPETYSTDLYARRAAELIARAAARGRPFFLSVGFLAPHAGGPPEPDDPAGLATPAPARRHRDRFAAEPLPRAVRVAAREGDLSDKPRFLRERPPIGPAQARSVEESYRQRLESLLAVDEAVVSIVDSLRQSGALADTLVIFTSDNGFFHGEHRVASEKMLAYEPSIRVPLVMRGPGVPAGGERRRLVTNADLAPTILDVAGAAATKPQDGISLMPLLADPHRRRERDLLIEGPEGFTVEAYRALRTSRYLYVRYVTGERELYDLRRDPLELRSLHADAAHERVERALARRLRALSDCAGRECRRRP